MVKYLNYALTFSEVPDEVNLCFNITNKLLPVNGKFPLKYAVLTVLIK